MCLGIMGSGEGFFSGVGDLFPEVLQCGDEPGVAIPSNWEIDYWLGRPVWAGFCTWPELKNGSLTIPDLLQMHRSLNLKEYLEKEAHKLIKRQD